MNTLEKEIYRQLLKCEGIEDKAYEEANPISAGICKCHSLHAAEVSMKWIEKAFNAGTRMGMDEFNPPLKEWLKENGLTPTEPETKEPVIGSNGILNGQYKNGD